VSAEAQKKREGPRENSLPIQSSGRIIMELARILVVEEEAFLVINSWRCPAWYEFSAMNRDWMGKR